MAYVTVEKYTCGEMLLELKLDHENGKYLFELRLYPAETEPNLVRGGRWLPREDPIQSLRDQTLLYLRLYSGILADRVMRLKSIIADIEAVKQAHVAESEDPPKGLEPEYVKEEVKNV